MKSGFSVALRRRLQRFQVDRDIRLAIDALIRTPGEDLRASRAEFDAGTKVNVETFDDGAARLTGTPNAKISHVVSNGYTQNITATRPFAVLSYELDDSIGANPVLSKVEAYLTRKQNVGQPTFDGFFTCQLYRVTRQVRVVANLVLSPDLWAPQAVGAPVRVYASEMSADDALVPFSFDPGGAGRVVIDESFVPSQQAGDVAWVLETAVLFDAPAQATKQRTIVAVLTAHGGTNTNYGLGTDTVQGKNKVVGGAGTLRHRTVSTPTLGGGLLAPMWWQISNPAPDTMVRATFSLAAYSATGSIAFTGANKLQLAGAVQGTVRFTVKGEVPTGTTLVGQARVAGADPWVTVKDGQQPADVGLAVSTFYEAQALFTSPASLDATSTLRRIGITDEVTKDLTEIAELSGFNESVDPVSGEVKMGSGTCVVQKNGIKDARDIVSRLMSEYDFTSIEIRARFGHLDIPVDQWLLSNIWRVDDYEDHGTEIELVLVDVLERLRGKLPKATGTFLGYLLKAGNSDLSGGADFTRELSEATETPGTIVVSVAASATEDSLGITRAGVPNILRWPVGDCTVKVNVSVANANLQLSVALRRVNAAGVTQQTTAFAPEQQATAGGKVFTLRGLVWGAGAATDRLVVIYRFRNTVGSVQAVTITTGDLNAEVQTPWTPNAAVQPKVYTAQPIQTVYLDWRDSQIGLEERYRGDPPPLTADVITKSVMDTDGKRELERIAYTMSYAPIASQGLVHCRDLQQMRTLVVAAFPMEETQVLSATPGLRARIPEFSCAYGWGRNKPEEFQARVQYQHAAALTKFGVSRIDNPSREVEKEIAQWVPDQGLADPIARALVEWLGAGFIRVKFNSLLPRPELDLCDTAAVETDMLTMRDCVTGDIIKGPVWVVGKIIEKSGIWGQQFVISGKVSSLYVLTGTAHRRLPFEYPLVEMVEYSNTHAAGTATVRMRSYPDTATIKYYVHADGTAPPDRESPLWTTYSAPVVVTRGASADQLISAYAIANAVSGTITTRRVAPVGVADISRPVIDAAVKASTVYQVTYHITARCPYGQQVKIKYRTVDVAAPSDSYASPAPSATALNNEPYATDITVARGMTDRWLETWAEDADGNSSFIARDRILAITVSDAENALTGLANTPSFVACAGGSPGLHDSIAWVNNAPAGWTVRLFSCGGAGCALPGSQVGGDNPADPFDRFIVTFVKAGATTTVDRKYRVVVINSYGEVVDTDDTGNYSTTYTTCP